MTLFKKHRRKKIARKEVLLGDYLRKLIDVRDDARWLANVKEDEYLLVVSFIQRLDKEIDEGRLTPEDIDKRIKEWKLLRGGVWRE